MMTNLILWARDNLVIPAGMVMVAAVVASVYQAGEANAMAYKMLAEQYPKAGAQLKAEIAEAMGDGQVSRWENTKLVRDILAERRALAWTMETGTLEQERAKLQLATGQTTGKGQ